MTNMGLTDVKVRRFLAIVMLLVAVALAFVIGGSGATVGAVILALLAVVFLVTSQFRTCPLYMPFGLRTDGNKD